MSSTQHPHDRLAAVGRYGNWIMAGLAVLALFALIAAISGFTKATNAQDRLTRVEAEQLAEKTGKQIAEVTTCFSRARGSPRVTRVFNALAGQIQDPVGRAAANALIHDYDVGTPSVEECRKLARTYGLNPDDYDVTRRPKTEGPTPKR